MTRVSASRDILYTAPPGAGAEEAGDAGAEGEEATEPPAADD